MVLHGAPVVPKNLAIWYTDGSNLEIRGCGAIEVWKNLMTSFRLGKYMIVFQSKVPSIDLTARASSCKHVRLLKQEHLHTFW